MIAAKLLLTEIERLHTILSATLKGLSANQLNWRPRSDANSMGFILWHILRAWDDYHQTIGISELYESEGWPQRFGFDVKGRGVEGSGMGTGFAPEDVAVVQVALKPLRAYLDALYTHTQPYLHTASDEALLREFKIPWWPKRMATPAYVLGHVMAHSYVHLGEVQSMRGFFPADTK